MSEVAENYLTVDEVHNLGIPIKPKKSPCEFFMGVTPYTDQKGVKYQKPEPYIRIRHSKNNIRVCPVTHEHKSVYTAEWREFIKTREYTDFMEAGDDAVISKTFTPLTEIDGMNDMLQSSFKEADILCVEDLAEREPHEIDHIYNATKFLNRARALVRERGLKVARLSAKKAIGAENVKPDDKPQVTF